MLEKLAARHKHAAPPSLWEKTMRRIFSLVSLLASIAITGPAMAGDWTVTCTDAGRCTALLVVADAATKRTLGSIGLQVGENGAEPAMIAFLPLGVELAPGFRVVIDGKAFDASYEVCFPDGCRAVASIKADDLNLWLDATSMSLRFFPYGNDRAVSAEAPTSGLRAALATKLSLAP